MPNVKLGTAGLVTWRQRVCWQDNGAVPDSATRVGIVIYAKCKAGYSGFGDMKTTCLLTGQWSGTRQCHKSTYCNLHVKLGTAGLVTCRQRVCWQDNGAVPDSATRVGIVIYAKCKAGYSGFGDMKTTCLLTGQWSGTRQCHKSTYCNLHVKLGTAGLGTWRQCVCWQDNGAVPDSATRVGFAIYANSMFKDKKEEIWPSPMTKAPIPTEMSKGQSDNTNNATNKVRLNSNCGPT